jgi:integrase
LRDATHEEDQRDPGLKAAGISMRDIGASTYRGLSAADSSALVFANQSGAPSHYSAWRRTRWREARTAAGVPGLRFHDLRSVAAWAVVAASVDVKTAQLRTRVAIKLAIISSQLRPIWATRSETSVTKVPLRRGAADSSHKQRGT